MSKSSKNKKNKVPKITEEEYVKYLSLLKEGEKMRVQTLDTVGQTEKKANDLSLE